MIGNLLFGTFIASTTAILYVQKNEIRSFDELNGLWTFVREPMNGGDIGLTNGWYKRNLAAFKNATVMPVPCSYNDMSTNAALRDHVGWVWYQKTEIISKRDENMRLFLRFGSVQYYSIVYFNYEEVGRHIGGHLPFEFEVTDKTKFGAKNIITVAVNNTLSWQTIPQADFNYAKVQSRNISGHEVNRYQSGFFKMTGLFDFFNYAGILRPVYINKKPQSYIEDIKIITEYMGSFKWEVDLRNSRSSEDVVVHIIDENGKGVFTSRGLEGKGSIQNAKPWWPRGMGAPSLYIFKVELIQTSDNTVLDIYREEFGFRTVTWDNRQLYINDKPFYCVGFGMHEDFEIKGRAFDSAVMTKDLNLFEWMGGNCYRTSHYPYSEERMREGDRRGIAVIVEAPAVGLKGFPKSNQLLHMKMVDEMIGRDKNHPSVIMWSIANEPHTEKKESRNYFKGIIDHAHALDITRPVTIVYGSSNYDNDQSADLVDIIGVNRYYGWYIDMGYIATINNSLVFDISLWRENFGKAILICEYGADSLPGLNQHPSVDFSEQYQNDLIKETHKAFDVLKREKIITGEMIWNFADFMTAMSTTRVVGNHKGVFTRSRQPKMAAYTLRTRYHSLLNHTDVEP